MNNLTEKELTQSIIDIDRILADMNKSEGYSNALCDVVSLLRDELTIDQIIKIHQLKFKKP